MKNYVNARLFMDLLITLILIYTIVESTKNYFLLNLAILHGNFNFNFNTGLKVEI